MIHYNLRAMRFHLRQEVAVVLVIAAATATLVLLLAALDSFTKLVGSGAERDNVLVVARGGLGEQWPDMSHVERETVARLSALEGIAVGPNGAPLVSPELLYTGDVQGATASSRITVRGVGANAFHVHRKLEVHRGESAGGVLLGANVENLLPGIQIGDEVRFAGRAWRVAGFFRTRERQSAFDSEIWAPLEELMHARKARDYGTVTFKAESAARLPDIVERINDNMDVLKTVRALPERRSDGLESTLRTFDVIQTLFSALLVGAAGTAILSLMLDNVMRRARDMALLRALGSSPLSIGLGFVAEGVMVAIPGAILGVLAAVPLSGMAIKTGSGNRLGLVVVELSIGAGSALSAVLVALLLAGVASLVPALHAARFTVRDGIRAG